MWVCKCGYTRKIKSQGTNMPLVRVASSESGRSFGRTKSPLQTVLGAFLSTPSPPPFVAPGSSSSPLPSPPSFDRESAGMANSNLPRRIIKVTNSSLSIFSDLYLLSHPLFRSRGERDSFGGSITRSLGFRCLWSLEMFFCWSWLADSVVPTGDAAAS